MPTPRHLLNDDDDVDDSEANFHLQYGTWTKCEWDGHYKGKCQQLVVAAPKLALYAKALGESKVIGSITVGFTKQTLKHDTVDMSGIYENDPENSETAPSSETLHHIKICKLLERDRDVVVVELPVLEPRDCYSFSDQLFKCLKPAEVLVLSPSNIDTVQGGPLFGLYTSFVDDTEVELPVLRPPAVIVGAPASILGKCETLKIPASALIVQGDGPYGHEVVDHEAYGSLICRTVEKVLKLPLKTIHPGRVLDNGMFL